MCFSLLVSLIQPIIVFERVLQPRFAHVDFINQPCAHKELQVLTFVYFHGELSSPGKSRQRDHIVLLVVDSSFLWCWGQWNGKRIHFAASPYMGLLASNYVSFL